MKPDVSKHTGLVHQVVLYKLRRFPEAAQYRDDLLGGGYLGLCEAAIRYDPSIAKFSTFAWWWIAAYVHREWLAATGWRRGQSGGRSMLRLVPLEPVHTRTQEAEPAPAGCDLTEARLELTRRLAAEVQQNKATVVARRNGYARAVYLAEAFVANHFGEQSCEDISSTVGRSRQALAKGLERVQPHFEAWAAELRAELEAA